MISCSRGPPAPLGDQDAIERTSAPQGLHHWMNAAQDGHSVKLSGMHFQPIIKSVREVGHRRHQRDLDDLLVGEVLVQAPPAIRPRPRSGSTRARTGWRRAPARLKPWSCPVWSARNSSSPMPAFFPVATCAAVQYAHSLAYEHSQVDQFFDATVHRARPHDRRRTAARKFFSTSGRFAMVRKKWFARLALLSRSARNSFSEGWN